MNKSRLYIVFFALMALLGCNPEAKWETKNVTIQMSIETVSAGFIECSFSTNKDAYYLIAIEPAQEGVNPMDHQKQFMTLALDSANVRYLAWREKLLKEGEFNVAPFSSHALQYGSVNHFFTGLLPGEEYWVYAFVVDPVKMKPEGTLLLTSITTTDESIIDVHFDYRVKGEWDYIYPLDTNGNIYSRFPYIATTRDSLDLDSMEIKPVDYFVIWALAQFLDPSQTEAYYGVKAIENDGEGSYTVFEEGHTYYTAFCGFDGSFKQLTVYKFFWTAGCEYYFTDTDSTNLARMNPQRILP